MAGQVSLTWTWSPSTRRATHLTSATSWQAERSGTPLLPAPTSCPACLWQRSASLLSTSSCLLQHNRCVSSLVNQSSSCGVQHRAPEHEQLVQAPVCGLQRVLCQALLQPARPGQHRQSCLQQCQPFTPLQGRSDGRSSLPPSPVLAQPAAPGSSGGGPAVTPLSGQPAQACSPVPQRMLDLC